MFDGAVQDVRYAVRLLARNPLFALTASLSLAIGIGANTTIFTIANALLFRAPVGIPDAGRLVDVGRTQNGRGFDNNSYPNYLDVRQRQTVFEDVYAYRTEPQPMSLAMPASTEGAERIYGTIVSGNYFTVLGVRPHAGRFFTSADGDRIGESPFVVLSHKTWTRRFNGDSGVIGQPILLNGHPFTVVGVAPEGFHGTTILTGDAWVPIAMADWTMPRIGAAILGNRIGVWLLMGARLKPGVTIAQANAEIDVIGRNLEREYPTENRGRGLKVMATAPVPGDGAAAVAAFMAILMAIVGLVLIIACVNLAGVLLARAAARRREIAVRLAVGAGRGRLVRQLLTEALMIFAIGGVAGLAVARVMTALLVGLLPSLPFPVDVSLPLDTRVLAFTLALSFVAAVACGLAPALHASKGDVVSSLRDGSVGRFGRLRLRHAFLVFQVALSLLLVVAASLFLRALQRAATMDPGFDVRGVELTAIDLSIAGYDETRGRVFARQLLDEVRGLAGVESAAIASILPLGGSGFSLGPVAAPGASGPDGPQWTDADWNVVEPGYFATMRLALVAGRDFTPDDRDGARPVVIVNETLAQRFWPGQDPLGREVLMSTLRQQTARLLVVGVARDFKYRSLNDRNRQFVFVPLQQQYTARVTVVTRTAEGRRLQGEIRSLLARMDSNLPIVRAQTLEDYTAIGLIPQRVAASVSGSLGIVGLLLAAIGIYGVTAYMVTSRTREIGIRIALGAQRGDVVRMVLGQGMTLAAGGVLIGLVLAAGASRLLGALLFGIGPMDPLAFIGSAILFCLIGLAACYAPARRATEIHAIEALRHE
jgi:predicted permease